MALRYVCKITNEYTLPMVYGDICSARLMKRGKFRGLYHVYHWKKGGCYMPLETFSKYYEPTITKRRGIK